MMPIRLLLCHSALGFSDEVRKLLVAQAEIVLVGGAADARRAAVLAHTLAPDIALVDVHLPPEGGAAAVRAIAGAAPNLRIVATAAPEDACAAMDLIDAGAASCYLRGAPLWELERALAGASGPLARLGHRLLAADTGRGIVRIVAEELRALTGAAFTAGYLLADDRDAVLVSASGPMPRRATGDVPAVLLRAVRHAHAVSGTAREIDAYSDLGLACSELVAIPFFDGDDVVGGVLLAMDAEVSLQADEELVSAVVELGSAALVRLHSPAREQR